jgi:hypothetical protein
MFVEIVKKRKPVGGANGAINSNGGQFDGRS